MPSHLVPGAGKTVLTGSSDETAQLWDAPTGNPIGPRLPHTGIVTEVAIAPDGKTLLTLSRDTQVRGTPRMQSPATVRLWDAASGQPIGSEAERKDGFRGSRGRTSECPIQRRRRRVWSTTRAATRL